MEWWRDEYLPYFSLIAASVAAVLVRILEWAQRRRVEVVEAAVLPDWNEVDSYVDLANLADAAEPHLDANAFLGGPFRRYLELCSDRDAPIRGRARVMEFCRGSVLNFARREGTPAGEAIEERARSMAEAWFGDMPGADYLLEVLDGISNHNFRMTRAEYEKAIKD